jgi:predicted nuclease of predicted toxin-antitoxin system
MIRFLVDENFNARIVCGLRRRVEGLDFLTLHHVSLAGANDREVLGRAAELDRIMLSHDVDTMVGTAMEMIQTEQKMAGLILSGRNVGIVTAIEDL